MSSTGAASLAALSPARAAASRKNGAKSRGPKTPEGKARSAQNALKHGLRAQKHMVLPEEDAAAFKALEAVLMAELAPQGALQAVLARRIVAATWRLERAERIEADLFVIHVDRDDTLGPARFRDAKLGLAVIRDGNGARAFETLLRYRGAAQAELWRALRLLKAMQAEAVHETAEKPIEPEPRRIPDAVAPAPAAAEPVAGASARPAPRHPTPSPAARPIEPESRGDPGAPTPAMRRERLREATAAALLARAALGAGRR